MRNIASMHIIYGISKLFDYHFDYFIIQMKHI
jgi:hypothetical protein